MISTDDIKTTVEAYVAAQCARDIDAIVALFAPDAVVTDPVHEPPHLGREAIHMFFSGTKDLADALDLQITGPIRAVDKFAAVPMRAISTIGGTRLSIDIVDVFTFGADGLIVDMKAFWDPSAMVPVD